MDFDRSFDTVDDLVAKGEARGTFVGVMVCFEQFSDELGFLWQENCIGCDGTEVAIDGIDDDIASCVCVCGFPHPLWHQDQAPVVSGGSEKGFVQEKTTQQTNQVGEEEEEENEDCQIGKGTECDDGSPNI
jgi:hypothetical protein